MCVCGLGGNSNLRREDFDFSKFTCVCVLCCSVVYAETYRVFKFPPVCGSSDVVCEDFEFSEFPYVCVCGLSTLRCELFGYFKLTCVWTLYCSV